MPKSGEFKNPFTIQFLLKSYGFEEKELRESVKLVRHALNYKDAMECYEDPDEKMFLAYQSDQTKNKYGNAKYIVSFVAEGGCFARFYGLYKIGEIFTGEAREERYPKNFYCKVDFNDDGMFYELKEDHRMDEFKNRIVIDWGSGTRCWVQNGDTVKYISAITHSLLFPGYENISLSFSELQKLFQNGYKEWEDALKKVYGVYAITCDEGIYIGSAYGEEGVWGRWQKYAETKHGDDVELKEILGKDPDAYKGFTFSLLKVFPNVAGTSGKILDAEKQMKLMLCTRNSKWGLNKN